MGLLATIRQGRQRRVPRTMSAPEYKAALAKLRLTEAAAASLLGVHEITSSDWASGRSNVNESAARLLRFMINYPLPPAYMAKVLGLTWTGRRWIDPVAVPPHIHRNGDPAP